MLLHLLKLCGEPQKITPAKITQLIYWTISLQLPAKLKQLTLTRSISRSGLFDSSYYLRQNPDVTKLGIDPLDHFINIGSKQGFNPNPLFNTNYYLEQNPEVATKGTNPLFDYLNRGALEGIDPHPVFDSLYYLKQNPDVASSGANPLAHYLSSGAYEGRLAWPKEKVLADFSENSAQESFQTHILLERHNKIQSNSILSDQVITKVGVYCSSLGNYFMSEMADLIVAALQQIKIDAVRLSENDFHPDNINYNIVVAPHEFFYLGNHLTCTEDINWLSRTVMINVEQPHTSWFSKSFHFLKQASLVYDINLNSANFLRRIGIPAYFLPLGYLSKYKPFSAPTSRPNLLALESLSHSLWNCVTTDELPPSERQIDLLFIGHLSKRRQEFLAKSASWLSKYRCFLHVPPLTGVFKEGEGNALTTEAVIGLSQRSKVLLNIHHDDLNYFEWHRIVFHGLWQKTLVLTEPCHKIPGLVAGEHYLEVALEDMEAKLEWLLNTREGMLEVERVRYAGHAALAMNFNLEDIIRNAFEIMCQSLNT